MVRFPQSKSNFRRFFYKVGRLGILRGNNFPTFAARALTIHDSRISSATAVLEGSSNATKSYKSLSALGAYNLVARQNILLKKLLQMIQKYWKKYRGHFNDPRGYYLKNLHEILMCS